MATTPRGYPYPELTDAPAGPTQIEALAQAIDTDVQAIADQRTPTAVMMLGRSSSLVEPVASGSTDPVTSYDEGILVHKDLTGVLSLAGDGGILVAEDGLYEWFGTAIWDAVGSGTPSHARGIYVLKNSVQPAHQNGRVDIPYPAGSWGALVQSGTGKLQCDAGDELQLALFQNTSNEVDVTEVLFGVRLVSLT